MMTPCSAMHSFNVFFQHAVYMFSATATMHCAPYTGYAVQDTCVDFHPEQPLCAGQRGLRKPIVRPPLSLGIYSVFDIAKFAPLVFCFVFSRGAKNPLDYY